MVSAFLTWKRPAMAGLLLCSALVFATAQAQTNSTATRGAEKPLPGQGKMEIFEDELFGNHQPIDMALPGVPDLTRRQRVLVTQPDARAKEKMDAEKNWVFSGINQLNSPPKAEDLLGMPDLGPDGLEKPKPSAMEEYYDGLGGGRQMGSNQLGDVMSMMLTMKQLTGTNGLNPMVFAFPAGDQSMLKTIMLMPDMNHSGGEAAGAEDSTAAPDTMAAAGVAASADREQKRHQDIFKQLLEGGPSAPASYSGLNSYSSSQPDSTTTYAPSYSPVTAPFTPSSLSPVTAGFTPPAGGGYHPYDPGSAAPAANPGGMSYEAARAVLMQPSKPVMQPPVLDPFAQNFPKHNF
jgi:hypothetical protein